MSTELLETLIETLDACPACGALGALEVTGLIGKKLGCKACSARWSAGTWEDGRDWMALVHASKDGLGAARLGALHKAFAVKTWTDPARPVEKIESYGRALEEAYGDFEHFKSEIGRADFRTGWEGICFIGPTADIVAVFRLQLEGGDVKLAVIDQTPELDTDEKRQENDLFCYMIAAKLNVLLQETPIPVAPYVVGGEHGEVAKAVDRNFLYPFTDVKERTIKVRDEDTDLFAAFSQMKPRSREKI